MKKYERILECISKLEKALSEKKLTENTTFIINFHIYFSDCIEKVFRCFYYKRRYELPAFDYKNTDCSLNSEVKTFLYNAIAKLKTIYDVENGIGNSFLKAIAQYNEKSLQPESREMPNNSLREETATLGSENFMARGLDLFIKKNWHGNGDWLRKGPWKVLLPPIHSFMGKKGLLTPDGFAYSLSERFARLLENVIKITLTDRKDGNFNIIGFEDYPNYPDDLKRTFFDQLDIGIALAIERFLNLGINEVRSWTGWTANHILDPGNKVINNFEDGIYNICTKNEISELGLR